MPLQFVKVGQFEMAKIRIINGCRQNVYTDGKFVNRSCAEREVVEVLVVDAWHAIAENQAVPYETLPGVDAKTVPAATPDLRHREPGLPPTPIQPPAETPEVYGEDDAKEAADQRKEDRAEDAAAAAKVPAKKSKK